jgi:hypothetical protein
MMSYRSMTLIAGAAGLMLFTAGAEAADPLPAALLAMHQRSIDDGECAPLDAAMLSNYPPIVAVLSPTDTLYGVLCSVAAFNAPWRLYVVSTGDQAGVHPLIFAEYADNYGWVANDVLFNTGFDPKSLTLTAHEYFDPAADCGWDGTWVWKDFAFALLTYRYQGTCDGTHAFKDWPTIWQLPAAGAAPPSPGK